MPRQSRRTFLAVAASAALAACSRQADQAATRPAARQAVIDIHQHVRYSGRTDEQLLAHQEAMGVTLTLLLPAGRYVQTLSTHHGKSNGLAANIDTNDAAVAIARRFPSAYRFYANEVPDLPETKAVLERYLKLGAVGIGEQKFNVPCDGPEMALVYDVARHHGVPVLLHFQHGMYNHGYERFGKVLEKWHDVTFIGHAQTVWANIDAGHADQAVLYPKGPVKPGGLTDRYLADHANFYGDLSAGSGLNALLRDEPHAATFLARHRDKLMYGSDCNDPANVPASRRAATVPACQGQQTLATLRRLVKDEAALAKLLHGNARRVFRL